MPDKAKTLSVFVFLLGLIGFIDATYLTIKHYVGGTLPCSLLKGCDTVTNSTYSMLGPVPIALLGALFYLLVLVLVLAYWQSHLPSTRRRLVELVWWLGLLAFLASLSFIYIQVFVLQALCLYCLISAGTSTLIFFLTTWWHQRLPSAALQTTVSSRRA